ncbi:hypothetical protein FACS1894106_2590 [Spirochaetia bacterium]|nr:hypothetical protein FACS1894106_2590 [Spirochaetia bacterium]
MKCAACGYEGEYFLPMELKPVQSKEGNQWDTDFKGVFACPECGTLKVDMEEQGGTKKEGHDH